MSETKFTKGPWGAEAVMSEHKLDICIAKPIKPTSETGWPVVLATVFCDEEDDNGPAEAEDNARLIAAAPDLYEACKQAIQFIQNGVEFGYIKMPDANIKDSAHDTLPALIAAIAKARGE